MAVGVGATLLAALGPAIEATTAPPRAVLTRSTLEARLKKALPRAAAAGVGLLAVGGILLVLPGGVVLAFLALFAVILGFALLAPAATVLLMRLARRPMGALFGFLGRLAGAGWSPRCRGRQWRSRRSSSPSRSPSGGGGDDPQLPGDGRALARQLAPGRPLRHRAGTGRRLRRPSLDPALADRAAALPGVVRVDRIRRAEVYSPGSSDGPGAPWSPSTAIRAIAASSSGKATRRGSGRPSRGAR